MTESCENITNWNGGIVCSSEELPFGPARGPLRLVDVTGDAAADLVFLTDTGLGVARGDTSGGYASPEEVASAVGTFEVADLNSDGVWEVIAAPPADSSGKLQIISARSDGALETTSPDREVTGLVLLAAADLLGNGSLGIVVAEGTSVFALLDPLGEPSEVEISEATAPSALRVLRNVDGQRGGILAVEESEIVGLHLAADGTWLRTSMAQGATGEHSPISVDLNQNGADDAVLLVPPGRLLVLLDAGPQAFQKSSFVSVELGQDAESASLATADVNSDGNPDLVVLRADGNLLLLLGDGSGNFSKPANEKPWSVRWVGDGNSLALGTASDGHTDVYISSIPNPDRNITRLNPSEPRVVVTTDDCLGMAAQ